MTAGVPTNFQSETALESFISGSWLGKGPGEGTIKRILPDSHTDYIFAVIGEEFGVAGLHRARRVVRLHRGAQPVVGGPQRRPVLPLRDGWPRHAVRPAGLHQHGGEFATDAGQGHDLAVCLLWRVVVDFAGAGHWFPARRDAPSSSRAYCRAARRRRGGGGVRWGSNGGRAGMSGGPVLLAAGGTGGHLFPAEALAHVLEQRGVAVELVTDERALRYGDSFPARAMHTIRSATPRGGSIFSRVAAVARLGLGVAEALALLLRLRPSVVIGFGGYPTVPPLVAASLLRIPTVLHEANGVMGKANRFLAGRVDAIAAGFPLPDAPPALRAKITVTGNPLRPNALAAIDRALSRDRRPVAASRHRRLAGRARDGRRGSRRRRRLAGGVAR